MEYADKGDLQQYIQRLRKMAEASKGTSMSVNDSQKFKSMKQEESNGLIELGE